MTQHLTCRAVDPSDERTYLVHFSDTPPLEIGELVDLPHPSEGRVVRARVTAIRDEAPPFRTLPIYGRAES